MNWLQNEIIDGISTLIVLRLPNTPAADTVEAVAKIWVNVFLRQPVGWQEDLDKGRIQAAFLRGAGNLTAWPAPRQIIELLPPRPVVRALAHDRPANMPANIRAELDKALNRPAAQVVRGALKPTYTIQFYELDGEEMAFNILPAKPFRIPATKLECLIHSLAETLGKLGRQLNKPTTEELQP